MKLALSQALPQGDDVDAAFAQMGRDLRAAAQAGAQVLVMPELFVPGYNQPARHQALAQDIDGSWIARARDLARASGCALVLGWAERAGADLFNAATAIGPDGAILAHYRKIQLFGPMERAGFRPGQAPPPVFDLAGQRCGLLICYDVEFPGHCADLAQRGAGVVLVPTANPAGYAHVPEVLVPARAFENRQFIAYANYCGHEGGLAYGGGSVVAGPDGRALARAGGTETLLITTLPAQADYPAGLLSDQAADYRLIAG